MKCPNCVFMLGYKKADGMLCLFKGKDDLWIGLCRQCRSIMILGTVSSTFGRVKTAIDDWYKMLEKQAKSTRRSKR